ncbi:MAG: hypothetical protein JJT96_02170 [Opitutales bacterium]|nr:hypothetical protein [Opitutales bacterium]
MNKTSTPFLRDRGQTSAVTALGFLGISGVCLVTCLGILLGFPEVLAGDPLRTEVLALAALAVPGFVASFVFGTFYAVASLLSGSGLWSRPLALLHLATHALGMGWLVAAYGGMPFFEQPYLGIAIGGGIILAGVAMLVVNLMLTAARHNRWEPAQLTVVASLFWLLLAGGAALARVLEPHLAWLPAQLRAQMEGFILLGLAGFLWLGLLGAVLKLVSMFAVGDRAPGALSWTGLVFINGVFFALVPLIASYFAPPLGLVAAGVFLGSLGYFADLARLLATARKRADAGLMTALAGIVAGLALLLWFTLGQPHLSGAEAAIVLETARVATVWMIFATVTLVALGLGLRLLPFLVWRIRCAPWMGQQGVPTPAELERPGSRLPVAVCLLTGAGYLLAGQMAEHPAGTQLGVLCLLVGAGWFAHAIAPAVSLFVLGPQPPKPADTAIPAAPPAKPIRSIS